MNETDQVAVAQDLQKRLSAMHTVVSVMLRVLSMQVLTLLALFLDAGVFAWAITSESWVRIAGATLFAVSTFCLLHVRPKGGS